METIEYQREWAKDVQLWFKKSHYEPVQHRILGSAPLGNCHQGIERFAAYGKHSFNACYMKTELEYSTPTLYRHQWFFKLTFCMACNRRLDAAQQQHECQRKCAMGSEQCGKWFQGDLNLRRHQYFHHNSTPRNHKWCGHEVRFMYDLHLLGYSAKDISREIPWRPTEILESAIKEPMYGCQYCQKVYKKSPGLENHSCAAHQVTPTLYHCYKCDKTHELESLDVCLGRRRKLNLGDQAEMDAFYEMQLRFLAQIDRPDSLRFWRTSNGSMERPEFWSILCELLWNRIEEFWDVRADKLERKMLTQLLRVARHEELFVSQGKGDGVIYVLSGNLDWYRSLRLKAHYRDERPLLSATDVGLAV
ncbi:uncharacterized protein FMAN_14236 [Fusarium mangiferae]|uniref:C2H2-type domain-containing protein n=1 Tax=Fusarium mangiferae TaxID=192010 RepID=A0A1L7UBL1_FUSMA|nr:uncharacterized protein FMAN_14236 [Fusarium mangiferae]CVL08100.1 uncharacterized protein FMAN_14236 [Fusarium mangiferae]